MYIIKDNEVANIRRINMVVPINLKKVAQSNEVTNYLDENSGGGEDEFATKQFVLDEDAKLQKNITAEETARIDADIALQEQIDDIGSGASFPLPEKETEFDLSTIIENEDGDFILDCTTIEAGTTHLTLIFNEIPESYSDYYINNVLQTDIIVIRHKPIVESIDWDTVYVSLYIDCMSGALDMYYYKNINVTGTSPYLIQLPLYENIYSVYLDITQFKLTNNAKNYISYSLTGITLPVSALGVVKLTDDSDNRYYLSNKSQAYILCISKNIFVNNSPIFSFPYASTPTNNYNKPANVWNCDDTYNWETLKAMTFDLKNNEYYKRDKIDDDNDHVFFYDKANAFSMSGNIVSTSGTSSFSPFYSLYSNTFYLNSGFTIKAGWFMASIVYIKNDGVSLKI